MSRMGNFLIGTTENIAPLVYSDNEYFSEGIVKRFSKIYHMNVRSLGSLAPGGHAVSEDMQCPLGTSCPCRKSCLWGTRSVP